MSDYDAHFLLVEGKSKCDKAKGYGGTCKYFNCHDACLKSGEWLAMEHETVSLELRGLAQLGILFEPQSKRTGYGTLLHAPQGLSGCNRHLFLLVK